MFDSTQYYFRSQNVGRRSRPLFGISTGARSFKLGHLQQPEHSSPHRDLAGHKKLSAGRLAQSSQSAPLVEHIPQRVQTIRSYDVDARLQTALGSGFAPPSSSGRGQRRFVSLHPITVGGVPASYKQEQRQAVAWAHNQRLL